MRFLEKVILKNFRSHKDTEVEFGDLTFIFGRNGAGKTSVVDALAITLTGRTPTIAYKKEDFGNLIRDGSESFLIRTNYYKNSERKQIVAQFEREKSALITGEVPPISKARMLYMLSPAEFFQQSRAEREKLLCGIVGIDLSSLSDMIRAKARSLGIDDTFHIATVEDIQNLIRNQMNDRTVVNREVKSLDFFKNPPPTGKNSAEQEKRLKELYVEVASYDREYALMKGLVNAKDPSKVKVLELERAKLVEELDAKKIRQAEMGWEEKEYIILQGYAQKSACPMGMSCPHKPAEFSERAGHYDSKLRAMAAEIVEVAGAIGEMEGRLKKLDDSLKNAVLFDHLRRKEPEMEAKRKELEELKSSSSEEYLNQHVRYSKAVAEAEKLNAFIEFLQLEVFAGMDLENKFNQMLAPAPYGMKYRDDVFYFSGRQYKNLSKSQKYRCQVVLASIIGRSSTPFVVLDDYEILDTEGRAALLQFLRKEIVPYAQTLVLASHNNAEPVKMRSTSDMFVYEVRLDPDGISWMDRL